MQAPGRARLRGRACPTRTAADDEPMGAEFGASAGGGAAVRRPDGSGRGPAAVGWNDARGAADDGAAAGAHSQTGESRAPPPGKDWAPGAPPSQALPTQMGPGTFFDHYCGGSQDALAGARADSAPGPRRGRPQDVQDEMDEALRGLRVGLGALAAAAAGHRASAPTPLGQGDCTPAFSARSDASLRDYFDRGGDGGVARVDAAGAWSGTRKVRTSTCSDPGGRAPLRGPAFFYRDALFGCAALAASAWDQRVERGGTTAGVDGASWMAQRSPAGGSDETRPTPTIAGDDEQWPLGSPGHPAGWPRRTTQARTPRDRRRTTWMATQTQRAAHGDGRGARRAGARPSA